ncbi:hypothetical protein PVAP13_6NG270432 [Panicum virgatum]|uniref:Uncharacterized protein n=1 Tax=Panicum virgatum TaxID=38727 RepID=A0A8T0R1M9_PANVG|nr:hypothetical protein PVAP13_6NG270432 [Panicum virgatum]
MPASWCSLERHAATPQHHVHPTRRAGGDEAGPPPPLGSRGREPPFATERAQRHARGREPHHPTVVFLWRRRRWLPGPLPAAAGPVRRRARLPGAGGVAGPGPPQRRLLGVPPPGVPPPDGCDDGCRRRGVGGRAGAGTQRQPAELRRRPRAVTGRDLGRRICVCGRTWRQGAPAMATTRRPIHGTATALPFHDSFSSSARTQAEDMPPPMRQSEICECSSRLSSSWSTVRWESPLFLCVPEGAVRV